MIIFNALLNRSLNPLSAWHSPGKWWLLIGAFLGQYLSTMVWVAGYKYTDASVASILNETAAVFIFVLGWLLLKEDMNRRKLMGAVISVAGVLMVLQMAG